MLSTISDKRRDIKLSEDTRRAAIGGAFIFLNVLIFIVAVTDDRLPFDWKLVVCAISFFGLIRSIQWVRNIENRRKALDDLETMYYATNSRYTTACNYIKRALT